VNTNNVEKLKCNFLAVEHRIEANVSKYVDVDVDVDVNVDVDVHHHHKGIHHS
jgi:hypothetical protein